MACATPLGFGLPTIRCVCGLGADIAETLGEAGYRVILADKERAQGTSRAKELADRGIDASFMKVDVASARSVERLFEKALADGQRIDYVINNAGILGKPAPIQNLEEADLDRVLDINLKGPFLVCKQAVRAQKGMGGGSILNIGSITAESGAAYFAPYAAAKSGLAALTRSMARNVGRFNIRVNCLQPGSLTDTDLNRNSGLLESPADRQRAVTGLIQKLPTGRPGKACDIAYLALFLGSPLAQHIHGAILTIDGGESLGFQ